MACPQGARRGDAKGWNTCERAMSRRGEGMNSEAQGDGLSSWQDSTRRPVASVQEGDNKHVHMAAKQIPYCAPYKLR
jgi:hypothetical protein